MTKFEPLTRYLNSLSTHERRMSFEEIEKILGFELPPSARKHRPWWSNNPHNSAMTKAWLSAGYRTEQVDMAGETLVFSRRATAADETNDDPRADRSALRGSPFGGLKGTVRIAPDVDLTKPAGEIWDADQGSL
ncbi:MAG TPA: hypothetical protein VHN20_12060 [Beijerinckiaceae bacterium]|nr:hypothetical protein [Beijerinckiaceae bacterium]